MGLAFFLICSAGIVYGAVKLIQHMDKGNEKMVIPTENELSARRDEQSMKALKVYIRLKKHKETK